MPDFKATLRKTIIQNAIFTGTGLNDLTSGGTYTGTLGPIYTIVIDSIGGTDTFKWKRDNGAYTTGVSCATSPITLSDGVTVVFGAITGHALADQWQVEIKSYGVDATQSANGEVLTVIDNSNYVTNTQAGHTESAFSDYRKIYIYKYGETTKTTITSLPHWDSILGVANTDTFTTPISSDDVYVLELATVPTWDILITYAIDDCVYYGTKLYKALIVSTGSQPDTSLADWVLITEDNLTADYLTIDNTIALVYSIMKCKDEKVYSSYGDINKIVNSQFSINESAINLWKIGINIRAIQIAVALDEWSRAQQSIKDTTNLCTKCITKTCAC